MKFAYLIAAHDKGDQLERLLDRLLPPTTPDFAVVHLDAKSALWRDQRERFARHRSGRVTVVPDPVKVHWGHHSQVVAMLKLLVPALERGFDLAHHISGADWPVATRAQIIADLPANGPIPAFAAVLGPDQSERMDLYWHGDRLSGRLPPGALRDSLRYYHGRLMQAAVRWQRRHGIRRRQSLGAPWSKGWSWWSLPVDIAEDVAAKTAALLRQGRLRFTTCCDEHVVPSILATGHAQRLADYRRFVKWPEPTAWNPLVLTGEHLPEIRSSGAWFARKLALDHDRFFLDGFPAFA